MSTSMFFSIIDFGHPIISNTDINFFSGKPLFQHIGTDTWFLSGDCRGTIF
jgi:hypothetical protein